VRDIVCNPQFGESASENVFPKTFWNLHYGNRKKFHCLVCISDHRSNENVRAKDLENK